MDFHYYLPTNLLFGRGKFACIGKESIKYGKKALIVTGGSSTKKSGLLDKTISLLKMEGINSCVFDQVKPNPLTTTVYEGAKMALLNNCDMIIGLGGGSSLDAAKGIAFQAVNGGDISTYIFGEKSSDKALPLILVPTTCGTGSEGNGFAVLSNPDTNDKKSLRCNAIIAKCSIIDPELMMTMPREVLASVGFDALSHNMEAYISNMAQPFTRIHALEGIRLLGENLIKVYQNPTALEGWDEITFASTLGGMVINHAGVTAPHGMEHPASGLKDITHGRGLAALIPTVFEESIDAAPDKFATISKLLGGRDEFDLVDRIRYILSKLNLSSSLSADGITEEDIDWMAKNCLKVSTASLLNHPKQFGLQDLKRIYRKSL